LKEWTTPDYRNTPSTTNLEEEEIVDAPGNDGNASMLEQVKRPNPWKQKKDDGDVSDKVSQYTTSTDKILLRYMKVSIVQHQNSRQF
jgi:hypothetical protein